MIHVHHWADVNPNAKYHHLHKEPYSNKRMFKMVSELLEQNFNVQIRNHRKLDKIILIDDKTFTQR